MTRDNFKSGWIFVLAAVGSAAGLGNVWRFPYLAYEHGGGAFFIAYFICLLVLGLPLLIMEIGLGQITRFGAPKALGSIGNTSKFKIIGWLAVLISFGVLTYYLVITSWVINYAIQSPSIPWKLNAQDYFYNDFLSLTSHISQVTHLNVTISLGVIATLILIYIAVYKGTSGIARVAKWITPIPFILLIVLLINSLLLNGAWSGLKLFLQPHWASLYSLDLWFDAASQVLFTLSLGFGVMFAYGAILKKEVNVKKMATAVIIGDTLIAFFSGIIIYSVLGYYSTVTHTPIDQVVEGGIGLAFIVFPKALALLPFGQGFFSTIFYLALFALAFTSIVSLFEAILAATMDGTQKIKRQSILLITIILTFIVSLIYSGNNGLYILDIVDHFIGGYGVLIISLLQAMAIGWCYDAERLRYNLKKQSNLNLTGLFNFLIRLIIPAILATLLLRQVIFDLETTYGGYPVIYVLGFGVGSLVLLTIIGIILNRSISYR
ncbi:MAG: neurotransmitter symporter family protein [Gammaproteobacteria bacterium]|nr:MAG: neurotransmitter symporter family protein [Gammaproteobacteria bacterium]UTW43599.1 sodium-dependent transporter [bacterium SCSIO 12844]